MNISYLNSIRACSSTILHSFSNGNFYGLTPQDRRLSALKMIDVIVLNAGIDGSSRRLKDMAFVTASTLEGQSVAEALFKELGFYSTEHVYNAKNATSPAFHVLDVPTFIKNAKALIDEEKKKGNM